MSTPAKQAGFSLVETLVALAIGALVTATTFSTLSGAMERSGNAERVLEAKRLAQSKLDSWSLVGDQRDEEGVTGAYRWRVTARPFLLDPAGAALPTDSRLSEIRVIVEWDDGEEQRSLALKTFRVEAGQ